MISASVVPGAKFEAWIVKGPAEPLIVRPGPVAVEGWAVPLRAALVVGVVEVVKEVLREEVTLALPLSISFAILVARALV